MKFRHLMDSPLGAIVLAFDEDALTGLYFVGQKYYPGAVDGLPLNPGHAIAQQAQRQLQDYFSHGCNGFSLALNLRGTDFQREVWRQLLRIDAGATTTYGAIARAIGRPAAVRAVGAAVGRNPVSIVVPCHRVIGASRSLTGYAGGLSRKQYLLAMEMRTAEMRTAAG